jgi:hypothetical protein
VKKTIVATVLALCGMCGVASADDATTYPFKVGGQIGLSDYSGAAIGPVFRIPHAPYFKLGAAFTYTLAPGVQGNLLLDPIDFPIAPVAEIVYGHQFPASASMFGVSNSPTVSFDYAVLQGGFCLGKRDGFRFMIMAGMAHLMGGVSNVQGVIPASSNLTVGNPNFSGWLPSVKLGTEWLF